MSEHEVRANHQHSVFFRRDAAKAHWCSLEAHESNLTHRLKEHQ
jgi:hypothetical protein